MTSLKRIGGRPRLRPSRRYQFEFVTSGDIRLEPRVLTRPLFRRAANSWISGVANGLAAEANNPGPVLQVNVANTMPSNGLPFGITTSTTGTVTNRVEDAGTNAGAGSIGVSAAITNQISIQNPRRINLGGTVAVASSARSGPTSNAAPVTWDFVNSTNPDTPYPGGTPIRLTGSFSVSFAPSGNGATTRVPNFNFTTTASGIFARIVPNTIDLAITYPTAAGVVTNTYTNFFGVGGSASVIFSTTTVAAAETANYASGLVTTTPMSNDGSTQASLSYSFSETADGP